jgi:hypothetical protein
MPPGATVVEVVSGRMPRLCIAAVCRGRGLKYHAFVASSFPSNYEAKGSAGLVAVNETTFVHFVARVFRLV